MRTLGWIESDEFVQIRADVAMNQETSLGQIIVNAFDGNYFPGST